MHREIQQIRAKRLNAPWPKYLRSVVITGLRGWNGQEVRFDFPVLAIAGENGSGKSTVLKVAAAAYAQPLEDKPSFYPGSFFVDSAWDRVSGATLTYKITEGTQERTFSITKKATRWRWPKRPVREVIFQDISRTLPIEATAGYAYIAKRDQTERSAVQLSNDMTKCYSAVLGRKYENVRIAVSRDYISRPVGVVQCSGQEYSQFHQGAGEDATLDLMGLLENVSDTSLILIDEVEASLHPRSQRRLIHFLLWLARKKHIQVIVSTHSPYVLEELPPEARVFISRGTAGVDILYGVSPNYALNRMDDIERPDLYLYTEDVESSGVLLEILRARGVELSRLKISRRIDCQRNPSGFWMPTNP
jgi:predicted ATP-dependent endonuclease of OLD family